MKRTLVVLFAVLTLVPFVSAQTTFKATMSWTDNADNEDGFAIERSANPPTTWVELGRGPGDNLGPDVVSYVDQPLNPGDDFCWRVLAFNSVGDSTPSNEACGAAPTTPAPPGGLTVVITQVP